MVDEFLWDKFTLQLYYQVCNMRSWAFLLLLDQAVKSSYTALLKLDAKSLASVQHQ